MENNNGNLADFIKNNEKELGELERIFAKPLTARYVQEIKRCREELYQLGPHLHGMGRLCTA